MSEIKFDLNAWKEANELINEQLTEYLTKKNLCEQWKYLMDEESTFGFFDPRFFRICLEDDSGI